MARKPTAAKKRRDPLSRERVLRAALEIADKEGIDALSMRRLGEDLGVKAMSLYKHVPNKDAVLDGMVDIVVGEITLPAIGGDWRAEMRKRARRVFWLDPEPRGYWDTGDSIISEYAPHCDGVYECRNLRQLERFVAAVIEL